MQQINRILWDNDPTQDNNLANETNMAQNTGAVLPIETQTLLTQFYSSFASHNVRHIYDQIRDGYMRKMHYYGRLAIMEVPEIPLGENDTGLPAEIWMTILIRIDYPTIIAAMRTSRLFYHLAKGAIIAWGKKYLSKGPMWKYTPGSQVIKVSFNIDQSRAVFSYSNAEVIFRYGSAEKLRNSLIYNSKNIKYGDANSDIVVKYGNFTSTLSNGTVYFSYHTYRFAGCCGGFSTMKIGKYQKICCQYCKVKRCTLTCEDLRNMNICASNALSSLCFTAPGYLKGLLQGDCCAANLAQQ